MRKIKSIILFAAMLFILHPLKAQLPFNDPAWQLQTAKSDTFSGTSVDASKWWSDNNSPNLWTVTKAVNATVSGGSLKCKVDTLMPFETYTVTVLGVPTPTNFYYQGGDIVSNNRNFKYGYLEINAKFPTGHYAYWPAFWLYNDCCSVSNWYTEVDICENGSYQSKDGHQMGTNRWMDNHPSSCGANQGDGQTISNLPRLDSVFHKYALQWDPNGLYYYFDNNLVRTYSTTYFTHAMEVIIGIGVQKDGTA